MVECSRNFIQQRKWCAPWKRSSPDIIVGLDGGDEVGGDDPGALVDQLVESVLTVRARLTPHNWAYTEQKGSLTLQKGK